MPQTFNTKDDRELGEGRAHAQLSDMIEAGRSFSGGERNCTFMNTGGGRFADASFASGFDFADDGRALVSVDWDGDGDLDVFVSNRNAPRVRFLRNDSPPVNRHVEIKLECDGSTTIGTRVEIESAGKRYVRTLRAGEGFLSQGSSWMHFGLGAGGVDSVSVHWAGSVERFEGVIAGGRFLLRRGSGIAKRIGGGGSRPEFAVSEPRLPASTRSARIPVVPQLGGTALNIEGPGGGRVSTGAGRPTLVLLWASWCQPCIAELREIGERAGEIRARGLEVIALNVDALGSSGAAPDQGVELLARMEFPFASAQADAAVLASFQEMHDAQVGLHRPLPVPAGFLLDARGRLSVIYKGGWGIDTVLGDLDHAGKSRAERWREAAALPGRTIDHPQAVATADLQSASLLFQRAAKEEKAGNLPAAIDHDTWALELVPSYVSARRHLGKLFLSCGDWRNAATQYQELTRADPGDADSHFTLGRIRQQMGELGEARASFAAAVASKPDSAPAQFELAAVAARLGDAVAAVRHYRAGLKVEPAHVGARNNLAWLLATHPDDRIRDGAEALELASAVSQATGGKDTDALDTLAAAQAESGDLPAAIATAERAIAIARAAGADAIVQQLSTRLAVYLEGEPFREAAAQH